MKATFMYGAGDVRIETVPDPIVQDPTDAIVRTVRACICGSDLHPYHSLPKTAEGQSMGHELIGVVEEIGSEVTSVRPGDFVIVPFAYSDNTCVFCREGLHTACVHGGWYGTPQAAGLQAEYGRVPLADGSLVKVPDIDPATADEALLASLLTLSDVYLTGYHGAHMGEVAPGRTVTVVGDGAVGLGAVLTHRRRTETAGLVGRRPAGAVHRRGRHRGGLSTESAGEHRERDRRSGTHRILRRPAGNLPPVTATTTETKNSVATLARKVPEITAVFWLTKLLTTALGEATSDYLVTSMSPYWAVGIGFLVFMAGLVLQFRARRYVPWIYWFTVAMVAVFGTMAADVIHAQFGIPYAASTLFFAFCLAAVFGIWWRVEKSLSIHSITTMRREAFYWLAVVTTFALGTAAGDWTAYSLHLGYLVSGLVFAAVMLIPLAGHLIGLNEVAVFWFAYIVTRPLGASFADWFGKSSPLGLGWGDGTVSGILLVLIVACVLLMTRRRSGRTTAGVRN